MTVLVSTAEENARLRALHAYAILDTVEEAAFDNIARLAAQVCGTPVGFVSFIDGTRQWFKARFGFDLTETPREVAFCAHTIRQREPLVVPDTHRDDRFAANPLVTGGPRIRLYGGAPLITSGGQAIGSVAVLNFQPGDLDQGQRDSLQALAGSVVNELELRARGRHLQAASAELNLLKAAVESAYDAVVITEADGLDEPQPRIVYVNPAFTRNTGYSRDEAVGRSPRFLQGANTSRETRDSIRRALATHEPIQVELNNYRRDGTEFPVELNIRPIHGATGGPTHFVSIQRDLGPRKKIEEQLGQASRLESLGLLAGGIAHDYNNLLTCVIGNLFLARDALPAGQEAAAWLESAERELLRAKGLTRQLLTFAKGGDPVRQPTEIGRLVREAAEFCFQGSACTWAVEEDDDLPPVEVDRGQITQVLTNLLINAQQAMPAGGAVRLEIRHEPASVGDDPGATPGLRIVVADEGGGIPREVLSKVFDPFFTTKAGGSGLGLATSFSIVQRHGGSLTLESRVGVGTVCTVRLPASPTQPGPGTEASGRGKETPARAVAAGLLRGEPSASGKRLLIVDDEVTLCESAASLLTLAGHRVSTAQDAEGARRQFQDAEATGDRFDLVILDLTFRNGDSGTTILAGLRGIDPGIKVLVSSGYSSEQVLGRFREHGFDGILEKPYAPGELRERVEALLAVPRIYL